MPFPRQIAGLVILAAFTTACGGDPVAPSSISNLTSSSASPSATAEVEATGRIRGTASPPSLGTPSGSFSVGAAAETDPVPHGGDAADDPAIWVNTVDPGSSLVIGTDKQDGGGLALYDLSGRQVAYYAHGAMNNVDIRSDIVVAGNESNNSIAIYRVAGGGLVSAASRTLTPEIEIYGSCLYRSPASGALYVFLTSKNGEIEQWQLVDAGAGKLDAKLVRSLSLDSQTEGCVADDEFKSVYFAEEAVGIWRFGAEPNAGESGALIDTTGGGHLAADIEGLAVTALPGGGGFLFASSQGRNEYTVYTRTDNAYLATFSIGDAGGIDGTSDTDGIDVTTASLGDAFPAGLFVAQDSKNPGSNQNFKLVSLDAILP